MTYNLAKRNNKKFGILSIDLDNFKIIDDTLGHDTGYYVLQKTVQGIKNVISASDTAARMGCDEYTIILTDAACENDLIIVANKLIKSIELGIFYNGQSLKFSVSIGEFLCPDDGDNINDLLKKQLTLCIWPRRGLVDVLSGDQVLRR
jgi:diguanylate cyclase (GGDEF)-like protein